MAHLQDVYSLDLWNVVILCVTVNLKYAVDAGEFAERPQLQLLIILLALQACK